jgi:hypothetical protein
MSCDQPPSYKSIYGSKVIFESNIQPLPEDRTSENDYRFHDRSPRRKVKNWKKELEYHKMHDEVNYFVEQTFLFEISLEPEEELEEVESDEELEDEYIDIEFPRI